MILCGFFLASLVPNISQRIHYVIAVVISFRSCLRSLARCARGPPADLARTHRTNRANVFGRLKMDVDRPPDIPRQPRAVIFDIGRVIVRLDPERALKLLAGGASRGRSAEQLWSAVQSDSRWGDWQEGRMEPREWHQHLTRQPGYLARI